MSKYLLLKDSEYESSAKAGMIVYDFYKADFGLSVEDTKSTGVRHISVTLNEDGDYPFFTVPEHDLEEI